MVVFLYSFGFKYAKSFFLPPLPHGLGYCPFGNSPQRSRKAIPFTKWDRAFYAKPNVVAFVRPGFAIQIVSAKIAADGTVTVDYKISDPKGLPLDLAGIQTPGTIAVSFVSGHMTKGSTQFTTYATRSRTNTDGKTTVTQASADSGGKSTPIAEGEYLYTFGNKVPAGFDATVTHRLAMYGSRNLTEFDLGTFYDDDGLQLMPAGGKPAPRDVVRTASCNKCHDQLAAHGGSRRSVGAVRPLPYAANDRPRHRQHRGYEGHDPQDPHGQRTAEREGRQAVPDRRRRPIRRTGRPWPFPADPRRCESCHEQKSGAAQADAYLKNPSRAACGSCHDNVNFATGANHVNLPQVSDNQCANCHLPQGELEFDASIKGAHTIPQRVGDAPRLVAQS